MKLPALLVLVFITLFSTPSNKASTLLHPIRVANGSAGETKAGSVAGSEVWYDHPLGSVRRTGYYRIMVAMLGRLDHARQQLLLR